MRENAFDMTHISKCPKRISVAFVFYFMMSKLCSVFGAMDKWYIHRVLRKDLVQLLQCLKQGETQYINKRRNITYNFKPVDNAITQ